MGKDGQMTEPDRTQGPPRKILLATDLSARCDRALDRAAALAAVWQAELIAVHALEQTDDFYTASVERRLPTWRRLPDAVRAVEDQLRRDMMQAAPKVTAVVEKGEPTEVVLRVAQARACDLIVTGIARDETLARFGLGTTVDRLLRRSRVPLLVVKQRARSPYGNILVATDFSESSRCALQAAMAFFPDQKLGIFHAYDAPLAGMTNEPARYQDEYRKVAAGDCATFLAGAGIPEEQRRSFELLVEQGHPSDLIRQYVRDRGVDLVVLGTHGRSALLSVLMGSTAKEILSSLSCDVLVVREPRSVVEGETRS
jgi:nucleotide-binding universal stress UspA family protein